MLVDTIQIRLMHEMRTSLSVRSHLVAPGWRQSLLVKLLDNTSNENNNNADNNTIDLDQLKLVIEVRYQTGPTETQAPHTQTAIRTTTTTRRQTSNDQRKQQLKSAPTSTTTTTTAAAITTSNRQGEAGLGRSSFRQLGVELRQISDEFQRWRRQQQFQREHQDNRVAHLANHGRPQLLQCQQQCSCRSTTTTRH